MRRFAPIFSPPDGETSYRADDHFSRGGARERGGQKAGRPCSTRLSIHQPHAARIDVSTGSYDRRARRGVDIVEESGPPLPPSLPPPSVSSLPRRRRRQEDDESPSFRRRRFAVVRRRFFLSSVLLSSIVLSLTWHTPSHPGFGVGGEDRGCFQPRLKLQRLRPRLTA